MYYVCLCACLLHSVKCQCIWSHKQTGHMQVLPPIVTTKPAFMLSRGGGEESPEGHPHRHRLVAAHLLRRLFWGVRRPHTHDAVLPAGQQQPLAGSL